MAKRPVQQNNRRSGPGLPGTAPLYVGLNSPYFFSLCLTSANPPFGIDWKREQKAVETEAAKGEDGRFAPGLPKISDGQQLFVLNGLKKLDGKGKMAIIQNGSPLFSGDAGSGPSEIRRYILENDWLDCIVQLSTDMFMNTGISTYIWVLDKDKPVERAGKVQLIDASHCFTPRRKSIGTKRNDISDGNRALIVQAYAAFKEGVFGEKAGVFCESKIFATDEFGYNKIVVERPLRYNYSTAEERLQRLSIPDVLDDLRGESEYDPPYRKWQDALRMIDQSTVFHDRKSFVSAVNAAMEQAG